MSNTKKKEPRVYELSIAKSPEIVTWTAEQVVKACDESIAVFESFIKDNNDIAAFIQANPDDAEKHSAKTYWSSWLRNLRSLTTAHVYQYRAVHHDTWSKPSTYTWSKVDGILNENTGFQKVIDQLSLVKTKVLAGRRLAKTDGLCTVEKTTVPNAHTYYRGGTQYDIKGIAVPSTVYCQYCREKISIERVEAHIETLKCKTEAKKKELSQKNFKVVGSGTKIYNAAKAGSIPEAYMIPTKYDVWVPEWVVQAADAYEKNGNKYAGMTLAEYLVKMGPTITTDKPVKTMEDSVP